MDFLGKMVGSVFRFIFWTVFISFSIGYTMGNYYGIKETYDNPTKFEISKFPGLWFLKSFNDPNFKKIIFKN